MKEKIPFRGCPGMASGHMKYQPAPGEMPSGKENPSELQQFAIDDFCMISLWQDIFCVVTPEGVFQKLSEAWETILGYTEEELMGKAFMDFIHPDDVAGSMAQMKILSEGEKVHNFINRYRCKDGSWRWMEWRAAPTPDRSLVFAIAREVTNYKLIEEEVKKKTWALNERLKELQCIHYVTLALQDVSVPLSRILPGLLQPIANAYQYPEATAVRITAGDLTCRSENLQETPWSQSAAIRKAGQQFGILQVFYLQEMPVMDEGPFLEEERKLIEGLANLISQFTDRSAAYHQSVFLSNVIDSSLDAIGTFRLDGTILSWNKGATRLYGLTAEEMIGKNIAMLYPEERKKDLAYIVSEISQGRKIENMESQRVKPDGTMLDILITITPLRDENDEIDSYLSVLHDITKLKNQERELRESEELLKKTQHIANIGSWKIDLLKNRVIWSDEIYTLLGLAPGAFEPTLEKYFEFVHPDDLKMVMDELQRSTSIGQVREIVHRVVLPDGEVRYHRILSQTQFDDTGRPAEVAGTAQDITEIYKERLKREQVEERFREVANFAGELIWEMDANGLLTYVNPVSKSILGYEADEMTGTMHFHDLFVPGQKDMYTRMMLLSLDKKQYINKFISRVLHKEGQEVILETTTSPVFDEQGEISGYRGTSMDVTQRITMEDTLKRSELQFRLLAENTLDVIWTMDINGKFLYVSPSVEKLRGFTAEEVMQQSMVETLTPASLEIAMKSFEESMILISRGEPVPPGSYYLEQPCKDGSTVWTEVTISTLFDEEGKFRFFLGVSRDITQRKQYEDELKLKEAAIQSSISGYALTALDGTMVYVNNAFIRMWGYDSAEEIVGRNFLEFSGDTEKTLSVLTPLSEGRGIEHEDTGKRKDGTLFDMFVTVTPVYREGSVPSHMMASFLDITERKKVEKIREEERLLLKTLIDSLPASVFMKDQQFRKTIVNKMHLARVAATLDRETLLEEELIGKTDFDVYPGSVALEYQQEDERVILHGESINKECSSKSPAGVTTWELISKIPAKDNKGSMIGMVGVAFDITRRKMDEIEDLMTQARISAQYRISLLENVSDETIIALALDEAVKMTGSAMGFYYLADHEQPGKVVTGWTSTVGDNPDTAAHELGHGNEVLLLAESLLTREPHINNDRHRMSNGTEFQDELHGICCCLTVPVVDNDRVVLAIGVLNKPENYERFEAGQLSVFLEEVWKIVKKARLTRELEVTREKAQEASKLKSSLLLNMSHELRTPLNGILGFAGLLKETVTDKSAADMVDFINISGKRLMVTLTSILELSQLESDRKIIQIAPVKIDGLLHTVIGKFTDILAMKRLGLSKQIEPDMLIETDQGMVSNIFFYIIDNALKFTEEGQVWVFLQKINRKGETWVMFRVKDTGVGISEEQMKIIFEPFRQGSEGIGRSHEGNGLGLTLCRSFLSLLGGEIEIESKPDLGSTFSIYFREKPKPEGVAEIAPVAVETEVVPPAVVRTLPERPMVLIVEDNEANAALISMYLEEKFEVEKAMNGKMAIKLCTLNDYDLILMDINLGSEMDGIEATREIRKLPKNVGIPVVAVTGYATDQEKQAILQHGLDDYISKPFNKKDLFSVINRVLTGTK